MKIEAKLFKEFLEKISIKDTISECKLNFEEEGVSVTAKSMDDICLVRAKFVKSAFSSYEKVGVIGVSSLTRFISVLDRFAEEVIDISVEKNLIKIYSKNREAELVLPSLDFIEDIVKIPKTEYDSMYKMQVESFRDSFKNATAIGIDNKDLSITSKDGFLVLEVGENDKIRESIPLKDVKSGLKLKIPEVLNNISNILNGDIDVGIKTDYPITIIKKEDKYKVNYVIAPIVENE